MSSSILSVSLITVTVLKKSILLSKSAHKLYITTTPINPTLILNKTPIRSSAISMPMGTFTTPPEFPSKRVPEVEIDPATPSEIPDIKTYPDEFIVTPEPEIKPPVPGPLPDPVPDPPGPGPDLPDHPIPSPPQPDIVPPPEVPPRQPPDVYPPNAPEIFPPPSTPMPDIIPPTGPMVV